jgi:hypothetical protein
MSAISLFLQLGDLVFQQVEALARGLRPFAPLPIRSILQLYQPAIQLVHDFRLGIDFDLDLGQPPRRSDRSPCLIRQGSGR